MNIITDKKPAKPVVIRTLVENRQARHLYAIEDTFTAGLMLEGWEVKAILGGQATFNGGGAYIKLRNGEAFIESLTITPMANSNKGLLVERNPCRERKLLLNRSELNKLTKKVAERGYTIVPLSIILNRKFKIEIGLGKGKNSADKRATVKERDLKRELARLV